MGKSRVLMRTETSLEGTRATPEESSTMTFKKDGADPVGPFSLASVGGFHWVGQVAMALGLIPDPGAIKQREITRWNHGRSRGKPTPRKGRRNMLHVSRRTRHKHRLARKAA